MARPAAHRRDKVIIRPEDYKLDLFCFRERESCDQVSHLRPVQATAA